MPVPIIIDCDPGHDDALAIMLAAGDPAVDLLAVTTVAGNQTLDKTTLNALRVCTVAGITGVPVAGGGGGGGVRPGPAAAAARPGACGAVRGGLAPPPPR
ncbi:nucleoside hydrolase, partial [Streptomyces sp. NPDC059552]|uniref:nucleoside hydrolase n=1 Tax=Streptomyces sp. NPDC059552 TaxID=3346862 RepID=UPI003687C241